MHQLIEPFDCDDLVFALGVEWEMFRQKLKTEQPFTDLVIDANAARIVRMCERQGRFVEHHASDYAGWIVVTVGGFKSDETPGHSGG